MKKLFNTFMVLLAMSLMVTAFVSCKNDSDDDNDDDSPSTSSLASFVYVKSEETKTVDAAFIAGAKEHMGKDFSAYSGKQLTLKKSRIYDFYASTWEYKECSVIICVGKTIDEDSTVTSKGTYQIVSGDFTNGVLSVTITHD